MCTSTALRLSPARPARPAQSRRLARQWPRTGPGSAFTRALASHLPCHPSTPALPRLLRAHAGHLRGRALPPGPVPAQGHVCHHGVFRPRRPADAPGRGEGALWPRTAPGGAAAAPLPASPTVAMPVTRSARRTFVRPASRASSASPAFAGAAAWLSSARPTLTLAPQPPRTPRASTRVGSFPPTRFTWLRSALRGALADWRS